MDSAERHRVMPLDRAEEVLVLQFKLFPELLKEFTTITGGITGLVGPMVTKLADEISYEPDFETTPSWIRRTLGAPTNDEELLQWRRNTWDEITGRKRTP